jgi:hypothetical protein
MKTERMKNETGFPFSFENNELNEGVVEKGGDKNKKTKIINKEKKETKLNEGERREEGGERVENGIGMSILPNKNNIMFNCYYYEERREWEFTKDRRHWRAFLRSGCCRTVRCLSCT